MQHFGASELFVILKGYHEHCQKMVIKGGFCLHINRDPLQNGQSQNSYLLDKFVFYFSKLPWAFILSTFQARHWGAVAHCFYLLSIPVSAMGSPVAFFSRKMMLLAGALLHSMLW